MCCLSALPSNWPIFQEDPGAFSRVQARKALLAPMDFQEIGKMLEAERGGHKLKGMCGLAAGRNY